MKEYSPEVVYQLAMGAGKDAANRNMKKAGREKWDVSDWNVMCDEVDRILGPQK
jgi:hypothetical protein